MIKPRSTVSWGRPVWRAWEHDAGHCVYNAAPALLYAGREACFGFIIVVERITDKWCHAGHNFQIL